jgi:hypothetical protein
MSRRPFDVGVCPGPRAKALARRFELRGVGDLLRLHHLQLVLGQQGLEIRAAQADDQVLLFLLERRVGVLDDRLGLAVAGPLGHAEQRLAQLQRVRRAAVVLVARDFAAQHGLHAVQAVAVAAGIDGDLRQQLRAGLRQLLAPRVGLRARGADLRVVLSGGAIGLRQVDGAGGGERAGQRGRQRDARKRCGTDHAHSSFMAAATRLVSGLSR